MIITLNLNTFWLLVGTSVAIIIYILTCINLTERHCAVRWIWSILWGGWIIVAIVVLGKDISSDGGIGIQEGMLTVSILWGLAHFTGCIGLLVDL